MEYVLITGGTGGIGFELARKFAGKEYGVVIVSSNSERLQQAKRKIEEEFAAKVVIYQQDLTEVGAATQLYGRVKKDHITVSILVNNAGFGLVGPTEQIDFLRDESMMTLNVINLVELCKLFLSDFYRRRSGKILNVASTGAFQPGPYTSTYYGSKAFVLSYSRAVRYEAMKKGVQVCTLCPGATKTNFFAQEGIEAPFGAMEADTVAEYAYKRLMKNKAVIVPGLANRIIRRFPLSLKMKIVAKAKQSK